MVISSGEAEYGGEHRNINPSHDLPATASMAAVSERSRSLLHNHNFSSLPCFNVKWGARKQLVCVKSTDDAEGSPSPDRTGRSDSCAAGDDGGIEAIREKLMLDLRAQAHQMAKKLIRSTAETPTAGDVSSTTAEGRPWNLRTRRAVCREPASTSAQEGPLPAPARRPEERENRYVGRAKQPRAKFSVSLSKREIEEDFFAITGNRPARRPKKRSKFAQRQIDAMSPGTWLTEVTADMYKVNEQADGTKR